MEIRKMKNEDTSEVLEMMKVFYASDAVIYKSSEAILKQDIKDACGDCPLLDGYVFLVNNEIAGYAMTALNYTTEYGGISVWVEDLYVKEQYRNKGIASTFLSNLEKYYPNAVRFKLEVEVENENAMQVYYANGFHQSDYIEMTKEK